jgi:hypothetical protein
MAGLLSAIFFMCVLQTQQLWSLSYQAIYQLSIYLWHEI